MKELMRYSAQRAFINTWFSKRARLDDLSRRQMFHAVAGMILGGKVQQERVLFKLRRTPHGHFRAHDLLDISHERRSLSSFRTKRVDDDVILLAVNFKRILRPIGCDFSRRIDQNVPVWKSPFGLSRPLRATIHDLP